MAYRYSMCIPYTTASPKGPFISTYNQLFFLQPIFELLANLENSELSDLQLSLHAQGQIYKPVYFMT